MTGEPRAPLAGDYREEPWWWAGVERPWGERPEPAPEPPAAMADVVVVGSGYTGMAAALELAKAGRHVVVLDRDELGAGASSRNGGIVHEGGKHGAHEYLEMPGGRALWDVTRTAVDGLEQLVADLGADCGWRRCGHVELAHGPKVAAGLRAAARGLDELDRKASYVPADELGAEVGSPVFHGGLVVEQSAALHPARWWAALAGAATAAGAQAHGGVEVTSIERTRGGGFRVTASTGTGTAGTTGATRTTVECGDVVVATNGDTGGLVPWLRRRILPIGSYIVATEPLDADLAASVSPRDRVFFDTRNFLCYWRLSPDGGRVLFGGRTSLAPTTVARSRDQLYRRMVRIHPQLEGVRIERAWGGRVALTADRLPHVGRHPGTGVVYAMGYCGTGVALSTHFGRLVGRWLGGGGPDGLGPYGERPWPRTPLPARVPWLLPIGGWWYQLQDRRG